MLTGVKLKPQSPDLHWASFLLWHIAEQAHLLMAPIWASLFLHTLPHTIGLGEHHLTGHFPHCRFRLSLSPFEVGAWLVPDQSDSLLTLGAIPPRYYRTSCQLKPLLSCHATVAMCLHYWLLILKYFLYFIYSLILWEVVHHFKPRANLLAGEGLSSFHPEENALLSGLLPYPNSSYFTHVKALWGRCVLLQHT